MITVCVVDDEVLVRSGIRSILEQTGDAKVVGEASNGVDAVEMARLHKPDVVMMDITMPVMDGITAARRIHQIAPTTSVVLLTTSPTDNQVRQGIRAGVAGILLKNGDPHELMTAVRAAAAGHAVVSPAVTRLLLKRIELIEREPLDEARSLVNRLSKREQEVLWLVAKGFCNLQIGRKLYVSEGAVKAHISKILMKMNCDNRVQAAIVAYQAQL
ncbi:response regulator [Lentzea flava]|uniref:DNA-binding response regulator n=1 Tax=Lentzea flava TaxID=103732 RepID=A0ABQ2VFR0_9PSEU|nr:response regulator transcription factor [Lentzea flava]MCP2205035.1 DNA-binding response regulator, NarL/FixJ family, contains REC and HTH domains [Lentzea flava]GGU83038.1 DNA-binding response regulator [Lentzea flava]